MQGLCWTPGVNIGVSSGPYIFVMRGRMFLFKKSPVFHAVIVHKWHNNGNLIKWGKKEVIGSLFSQFFTKRAFALLKIYFKVLQAILFCYIDVLS